MHSSDIAGIIFSLSHWRVTSYIPSRYPIPGNRVVVQVSKEQFITQNSKKFSEATVWAPVSEQIAEDVNIQRHQDRSMYDIS